MIWVAIFGLACGFLGMATGFVLVLRRRTRGAWVLVMAGLPGLIGGAYHTWRLWS